MSSIMRRLRLGKWRHFAGYDLEGNAYFERPNPRAADPMHPRATKRVVEYRDSRPMWAYQGNEMPIQWAAWLRKTRLEAPTMDELQADRIRTMKLQDNVAKLAEAYQEEKARIAASEQASIASASGIQAPQGSSEPSLEHQRKHEQPPASKEEALAEESAQQHPKAGSSAVAEETKQFAAEESVKQIPKEQNKPSEDADRPGAQALKQSPAFLAKTAENPGASWQPQSAAPTPRRRR